MSEVRSLLKNALLRAATVRERSFFRRFVLRSPLAHARGSDPMFRGISYLCYLTVNDNLIELEYQNETQSDL